MWLNSLSFLDNNIINSVIVITLVLYCSTIFSNINSYIGNLYNYSIVKLIVLLLIVYVSPKDLLITVLLSISYVISLSYMVNNEYFTDTYNIPNVSQESVPLNPPKYESNMKMNKINIKSEEEQLSKKLNMPNQTMENFFPMQNNDENVIDPVVEKKNIKNIKNNIPEKINYDKSCLQSYVPMHESVGNVCSPTQTFKNELNAQGLNYPEGFNNTIVGSPLN